MRARGASLVLLVLAAGCGPPKPYAFECPPQICNVRLPPPAPPPPCEFGTPDPLAVDVTLEELSKHPTPWMDKRVRVRGQLSLLFEMEGLYNPMGRGSAAIGFDRSLPTTQVYEACNMREVTIEGVVGWSHTRRGGNWVIVHRIDRITMSRKRKPPAPVATNQDPPPSP